ncbi:uncharacterized protein LY89DRAFT_981 [Mollisia scopiformis]|uniref:DUF7907 domain-containing protein n=1 Tax=Mollisia scopiformis TaxID=149040 RepID=A0A194XVG8_MOLSC|nr:uncharacterized protein LY89DRAFT_981 [Mollisia scopiformis]KUJ23707.1 hypothetical protein LY89DRAFT_981 [Mollisia scopiformis]
MRASIITSILAFAASSVTAQYLNQSAPFYLVLSSRNTSFDGVSLSTCHEGAAIEGLCLGSQLSNTSVTYTFNTSSFLTPDPVLGTPGSLNYELEGGNFNLSSPMTISSPITTNVAVPLFTPSESFTEVGFDNENKLYVYGTIDDTVSPPVYKVQAFYRWYVCLTNAGYTYTTLSWVVGPHSPENPSCQEVEVKRVFA